MNKVPGNGGVWRLEVDDAHFPSHKRSAIKKAAATPPPTRRSIVDSAKHGEEPATDATCQEARRDNGDFNKYGTHVVPQVSWSTSAPQKSEGERRVCETVP